MKNAILFLSIITGLSASNIFTEPKLGNSWHFKKEFLSDPEKTRVKLLEEGPEEFVERDIPMNIETPPSTPEELELISKEKYAKIEQYRDFYNTKIKTTDGQEYIKNNPQALIELEKLNKTTLESVRQELTQANEEKKSQPKKEPYTIKSLFLERQNARATIIFIPGFWPGNKESFAPFVKIAPKDCNLLFLELSGHGESGSKPSLPCLGSINLSSCLPDFSSLLPNFLGIKETLTNNQFYNALKFITELKNYGLNEPNEIIEAMAYTQKELAKEETPIILFGWSAGAFLAARSLIKLRENSKPDNDPIEALNIKGLILDSGIGSISDVLTQAKDFIKNINTQITSENQKSAAEKSKDPASSIKPSEDFLEQLKNGIGSLLKNFKTSISDTLIKWGIVGPGKLLSEETIMQNNRDINLYDNIEKISDVKTLFIHSNNDSLAPIEKAKELASKIENHEFVETSGNCHATNHLEHTAQYKTTLESWLNNAIAEKEQSEKPSEDKIDENSHNNTQQKENPANNIDKKQELNKNIKRMIEIIDQIIVLIKTNKQHDEKLAKEFIGLLQDPESKISTETQNEIMQKLQKSFGAEKTTKEIQIKALEEIKEILLNLQPEQEAQLNKTEQQKADDAKKEEDSQKEYNLEKDKDKNYGANPDYRAPYASNPNTTSTAPQSTPSSNNTSYNNSGPSSGSTYNGPSGSNRNSSNSPSGSNYPSRNNNNGYNNGGYNGGYGDNNYYNGSNKNEKEDYNEKPNLTAGEYFMLDEEYTEEMDDMPDRIDWFFKR